MTNPTADVATLNGAFEIIEDADGKTKDAAGASAPEAPHPCRMTLGDFKRLGEFLDEFSGFGAPGSAGMSQ